MVPGDEALIHVGLQRSHQSVRPEPYLTAPAKMAILAELRLPYGTGVRICFP